MSKDEIIDKAKRTAYDGDDILAVYAGIERLKAAAVCTQSYCEDILDGGTACIYITAMLCLIEKTAAELEAKVGEAQNAILVALS